MFVTIALLYTYTPSIRCRLCKEVTAFSDTDIKAQKINMRGEVGSQSWYDYIFLLRKQYRKISTANQQHLLFLNDYLCVSNLNTWINQFPKVFRKTFVEDKQEAMNQLFDHQRLERVFRTCAVQLENIKGWPYHRRFIIIAPFASSRTTVLQTLVVKIRTRRERKCETESSPFFVNDRKFGSMRVRHQTGVVVVREGLSSPE